MFLSKKILCGLLGCLLGLFLLFSMPKTTEAMLGFGGKILNITPCANGLLLTTGLPTARLFMWTPGISFTYLWYQIRIGSNILGAYSPGGSCIFPNGCFFCGAIPAKGTIIKIGTSL